MPDSINPFDEVFRSKLSEHAVSPPDAVWETIAAKRSFGHIIANKISINWRTFGTMLLLLLGGGSSSILFGGEEQVKANPLHEILSPIVINVNNSIQSNPLINTTNKSINTTHIQEIHSNVAAMQEEQVQLPDLDLTSSIEQAAYTRPIIKSDPLLNILLSELDGWESAKPISFIRIYELERMHQLAVKHSNLESQPIHINQKYDYVNHGLTRKPFKERASFLFAFTPQTITKTMTANYNLSSNYLKHRNQSEQTRLAYTFEANLHYELKNHKFFETGINLTQIYEEMSFKGEKRFSNQYDFVEIPFLLGFEDRNSKWGYQIKGGLGVQVFNNYKGYIYKKYENPKAPINTEIGNQYRMRNTEAVKTIVSGEHQLAQNQNPEELLDLSNRKENPYKSSGVVNFHLAAGITYFHTINTSFIISPYYKRSINSITKESTQFTERISYLGISIGTQIKF